MSFSVGTLTDYTEENEQALIAKTIFGGATAPLLSLQTGIKSSETINIFDTDAVFQTGGSCGFNASGTTTITQRTITVKEIKVHESLCPKTLESKYIQNLMKPGVNEDIPFEEMYMNEKAQKIANALETAYWQGELSGGGGAQLDKFDGFLHLFDDEVASVIDGNADSKTDLTVANIEDAIDDMVQLIPTALLKPEDGGDGDFGSKVKFFIGWDVYMMYVMAIKASNFFHFAPDGKSKMVIPGTNIQVIPVPGLDGTDQMVAADPTNLVIGVDQEWQDDRFEIFFAKEADTVRFMAEWKVGVNVAFPDQIVRYKNAAS